MDMKVIEQIAFNTIDYSLPLKEFFITMRNNSAIDISGTIRLSEFLNNTINNFTIQRNETTFILQFVSKAIQNENYNNNEDIHEVLRVLLNLSVDSLTLNGKQAFYICIFNALYQLDNSTFDQFHLVEQIQISAQVFLFLLSNSFDNMQEAILKSISTNQYFEIIYDKRLIQNEAFQVLLLNNYYFNASVMQLVVKYICEVFQLDQSVIQLAELELPICDQQSVRFTTEQDYAKMVTQYNYLCEKLKQIDSIIQFSQEEFLTIQTLIQFLEQFSLQLKSSWDRKLFLEAGGCIISLFLLILGEKFQPQKAGRYQYCGFGVTENTKLQGFRTSLMIIIQRVLTDNPISWDWCIALNVIQLILTYQLGDGETPGFTEIISLCLEQWKKSQGCLNVLNQIIHQE